MQRQAVDEKIFDLRPTDSIRDWHEACQFYVERDAFIIDGSKGERTVAGKAVQFDGRHYVFLEKNIGIRGAPKYAHGGVLEKSAGGVWQVRQRYAPAMSLSLAERLIGLPRDKVDLLENFFRKGRLNDFFGTDNFFRRVGDFAYQWAESYRDRVGNWRQDAKVFQNNEGKLPIRQSALELTCRDVGFNRGEMRLVLDRQGHLLFTRDHYRSFILLTPSSPARVHVNALPMSVRSSTGPLFDPYHVAGFLLRQPVEGMRSAFIDQGVFDGKVLHQLQEISQEELGKVQSCLGRNLLPGFDVEHCRRISGTGMVVALPPGQDVSKPRVFVEGYVGESFSEVVLDKRAEKSLAYF